jgi:hypothetical protein
VAASEEVFDPRYAAMNVDVESCADFDTDLEERGRGNVSRRIGRKRGRERERERERKGRILRQSPIKKDELGTRTRRAMPCRLALARRAVPALCH